MNFSLVWQAAHGNCKRKEKKEKEKKISKFEIWRKNSKTKRTSMKSELNQERRKEKLNLISVKL